MAGLIYKDLCIMKKNIMIDILVIVAWSVLIFGMLSQGKEEDVTPVIVLMQLFLYICIFCIISGTQRSLLEIDEIKLYNYFVASTPLLRKKQVRSKYYGILGLSLMGVVWGFVCEHCNYFQKYETKEAVYIFMMLFFIQIILRAIELPFLFYYGQKVGKMVKVLMIVIIAFFAIVYFLFGKLPEISAENMIIKFFEWFSKPESFPLRELGVVALAMYVISYMISSRLPVYDE